MANIPVNNSAFFLAPGGSASGSFSGALALQTGSLSALTSSVIFTAFKFIAGNDSTGKFITGSYPTFNMSSGTKIEQLIHSCSLSVDSAPVLLYY